MDYLYCQGRECGVYLGSLGARACSVCGWLAPPETVEPTDLTDEQIEELMPAPAYHNGFGRSPDLWNKEQVIATVRAALAASHG